MFRVVYQMSGALSLVLLLGVMLAGCAAQAPYTGSAVNVPQRQAIAKVPPRDHYGFKRISDAEAANLATSFKPANQGLRSWTDLAPAIDRSLRYILKRPDTEVAVNHPELRVTWGQVRRSLTVLRDLLPQLDSRPQLLASTFHWYALGPTVKFTGYYEPTLEASWTQTGEFVQPLYGVPPDLRRGKPYHDRYAIDEKGVLKGRGLELAWIKSKVDSFFLQIQGSGRLVFTDGSIRHVLYADKNNRSYVALGRTMKDRGLIDQVSMRTIREYLSAHPNEVAELLATNPSYVFFSLATDGPLGAMGQVVTPWVSLAVDRKVFPLGAPVVFSVPLPGTDHVQGARGLLSGIGFCQDVGGAIKGSRADLFCGPGDFAEMIAGHLDVGGDMMLLLVR
jgi:membrane-bound lytic murein transglycosylase A